MNNPPESTPQRKSSTFKGDVLRLVSGTGFAQAIGILAAPVVARLFAPEAYGVAATFVSITAILGVIACLRYESSIVMPADDRQAANLLAVSLLVSLIVTGVTGAIVWIGYEFLSEAVPMPEVAAFLWLVPVAVLIQGVFLALNYWNSRTRRFARLSVAQVLSSVTTTSAQLGAGFAGYATGGSMIAANVGGQAAAVTMLGGSVLKSDRKYLLDSIRWRDMVAGLVRHRKFPLYSTWSGLLNTASWQLPVLMLGFFFSSAVVGFYALGFRLLQIPMNLIGGAISQVFLQRAAEAKNNGTLAPLVESMFQRLVLVGLFPMLVLTCVGEHLYIVVFGENWAEAGVYIQILSIWAFVWFVSSPLARLFFVLNKQEFSLALNGLIFVTRLASLGIGGYFESVYLALGLFALTGLFLYGYQILVVFRSVGIAPAKLWQAVQSNLPYFAPFGAAFAGLIVVNANSLVLVGVSAIAIATYGALVIRKELNVRPLKAQ